MKISIMLSALVLACATTPVLAQTADNPVVLNQPGAQFWNVYGAAQTHKAHKDKDVQGGGAMQVVITAPTQNAWDVGASLPVTTAYKKGDKIVVGVYAKLVSKDPAATVQVPAVIQINAAPYSPAIQQGFITVTTSWQLLSITGVANDDYAADKTALSLSLGGAVKTLELGPAFILNEGQ
ncbi:hypothetical protein [Asticcacaulis sp. AC466]|uniref:hypothetical protein n=1 Tax=Asticcacaulis sp. AC466 TaxID=1282362 RepID=UPI0003FB165A|nr:hypothetical protein [Asticcacaulis sp. AC466]